MKTISFLDKIREEVTILDGAMGTNLQRQNLTPDDFGGEALAGCNEILVETRPDAVQKVHEEFLQVGCEAVETNTFGATAIVLAEYDLADRAYELNVKAARLAKEVAHGFSEQEPKFVIGSIGPSTKLPSLGHITFDNMYHAYREQVKGLLDGGVDVLLVETVQDPLQAKCALAAIFDVFRNGYRRVPVMVQVTVETTGTLLLGADIGAALTTLLAYPVDVVGMNCATGPAEMSEHLRHLSLYSPKMISVLPNAGIPENIGGKTVYPLKPAEFADYLDHFSSDLGVNIVGGCCGTTPEHLAELVKRVKGRPAAKRDPQFVPSLSSLYNSVAMDVEPKPLLIGERTNANGSRKFRELLLNDDFDGMLEMAREQVREGAHLLDVCVAYVGRDEVRDMEETIRRFNKQVTIPLVIDSTEVPAIEKALSLISGKPLINSINLEDGEEKARRVLELSRKYGAAVIALTIDEEGMAKTADKKLAIAERLYSLAVEEYGLPPYDLFFDTLTFTLASGDPEFRRAGIETLEGIRRIKARFPQVHTILGVSNVSFGLKPHARHVLNSVFLHYAIEAGLDAAIVHAGKIMPLYKIDEELREICRRLIFDERDGGDPLSRLMAYFEEHQTEERSSEETLAELPIEEKLKRRIIDGIKPGLEDDLHEALKTYSPLQIINDILLDGMKVVGDLFGRGEMQLPFVLESAEVMKTAVALLEPYMEKTEDSNKGSIVLATVKGDVHDIGKNLVDIILTNNGYKVYNLGIKVPVETMLKTAEETGAQAIGMSGLLVKSTIVMKENLEVMRERNTKIPVILGGAALTQRYVEEDLRQCYDGFVGYARDAFDGLRFMELLRQGKVYEYAVGKKHSRKKQEGSAETGPGNRAKRRIIKIKPAPDIPEPPFWGSKVVTDIDLRTVFDHINTVALFRGQWQFKRSKHSAEQYQKLLREKVEPLFEELKEKALRNRWLEPAVVYGYFPCQSEGDDVIIYRPDSREEWLRFTFPRQPHGSRLCIADFFRPVSSGEMDVIGMMAVTMGRRASEISQKLFEKDEYSEYLYFHGLSVESAEALAEYWHRVMRQELGIADGESNNIRDLFRMKYRGVRYSFGYPACPNLEDQTKLFQLLEPQRIGMELTEEYQLVPEQSTTAIVVHHPQARYFNV